MLFFAALLFIQFHVCGLKQFSLCHVEAVSRSRKTALFILIFFPLFSVVTLQRRMLYVCIVLAANKENQIKWRQGGLLKKQLN